MSKHTPGPWCVDENLVIYSICFGSIGIVFCEAEYGKNSKADAKLIAAAPDLLEAMKKAVFAIKAFGIDVSIPKTIENMESAIAKVEALNG